MAVDGSRIILDTVRTKLFEGERVWIVYEL